MATKTWNSSDKVYVLGLRCGLSVVSQTATSLTYRATATVSVETSTESTIASNVQADVVQLDGTGNAAGASWPIKVTKDYTVTKTHSAQTVSKTAKLAGGTAYCRTYTDSRGVTVPTSFSASGQSVSDSYTIPAKDSYAVAYNANGGSGSVNGQTKWHDESLTLQSNGFTRSGYSFKEWNTKADGTGTSYAAKATYTGNAALTLYAIWTRTVTYNGNGSTSGSTSPQMTVATSGTKLASNGFTRTGYSFKEWNTKSDGSGTSYSPGATYSGTSITLYAIWNHTVSYNGNGATSGSTSPQTAISTSSIKLAANGFTRTGYSFKEWNTDGSSLGTSYAPGATYSGASITLYAIWNRTVSYDGNGATSGSTPSQTTTVTGIAGRSDTEIASNGFTRSGYRFTGWNTKADGSGTGYSPGEYYSGASVTLYAQWKRLPTASLTVTRTSDSAGKTIDALGSYVHASAKWTSDPSLSGKTATFRFYKGTTLLKTQEVSLSSTSGTATYAYSAGSTPLVDYKVEAVVADSAGYTSSTASATNKSGYSAPEVTVLSAQRVDAGGRPDDEGERMAVTVGWRIYRSSLQTVPKSLALTVDSKAVAIDNSLAWATEGTEAYTAHDGQANRTFQRAYGTVVAYVTHPVSSDSSSVFALDSEYHVSATLADAASSAWKATTLDSAYFTVDFLGDSKLYVLTTDTSVVAGKEYFTRSGTGSVADPYVYTPITLSSTTNPSASKSIYVKEGAQPGHGIGIGRAATEEGLHVAMDATFEGDVTVEGEAMFDRRPQVKVYDADGNENIGAMYTKTEFESASGGGLSTGAMLEHSHVQFGTLPVACGGTGQRNTTSARNYLGRAFATCSTGEYTAKKVAQCDGFVSLYDNAFVTVAFTNANSVAGTLYLNVNSTGQLPIVANGLITSSNNPLKWGAGSILEFVYRNSSWLFTGNVVNVSQFKAPIPTFYFPGTSKSSPPGAAILPVIPCRVLLGDGTEWLYYDDGT